MNVDDIEQDDMNKENEITENALLNKYSNNYKEMPFYLMTLEDNFGECKQIKIYQDSDPFELSYNFCKENNLDFESMKYIKKNIKEIIKRFSDNEKKESNFINSDSIYELVDEENFVEESDDLENDTSVKERNITEKKGSRSSNKLICSLMKRKIKFNHKINGVAPLQKKINEQIKKISHIKKNDFTNSQDIISNKNKNKKSSKLNEYNLIEIKNNNTMYSSTRANELSVKKNRLIKSEKNWNSDNKKTNTFVHPMDPSEYGVPELKENNNNNLNMFKYVEKVLKKNDFNIESDINQKYDSATRKYEDEEDDLDNDEDDEKSIPKEKIKNIKIEIETTGNKDKVKKNNSFHLNKMINNINNNNYSYNYNYHINNNNNININNNNIFNNINALNYNNEQYPFNYIDSNQLVEHKITYKKISKEIKKDNQTKKNKKNVMNKEKVKDLNDMNDKKNMTSFIFSSEYKNHLNKNAKNKKNMDKNLNKFFSQNIKKILKEYQNIDLISKKFKKNTTKRKFSRKYHNRKKFDSPKEKSNTLEDINNFKIRRTKKNLLGSNNIKSESMKFDCHEKEAIQSLSHSERNNKGNSKNKKRASKSLSETTYFKIIKNANNSTFAKKFNLNQNLKKNVNTLKNIKLCQTKKLLNERPANHNSYLKNISKDFRDLRNSKISFLIYSPKSKKSDVNNKNCRSKKNKTLTYDQLNLNKLNETPKYLKNFKLYKNKEGIKIRTTTPNFNKSVLNLNNKIEYCNLLQTANEGKKMFYNKNFSMVKRFKNYFNQENIKNSFAVKNMANSNMSLSKTSCANKEKNIKLQILNNIFTRMFIYFKNDKNGNINLSKSFSDKLKAFPQDLKKIYIKMLEYLYSIKNNKIINQNTFVKGMINAYNLILSKNEQNIIVSSKNEILLLMKKNNIQSIQNSVGPNHNYLFSTGIISPIHFNNSKSISIEKINSKENYNTFSFLKDKKL